jgi:hypothetical protein
MSWRETLRDPLFLTALGVSLLLHIALFILAEPWNLLSAESRLLVGDAAHYHVTATRLAAGEGLEVIPTFRTPGYPLFVAFFYKVFGAERLWLPLAVQVVISLAILPLVFRIARETTTSLFAARFSVALFAISIISAFYATRLLSETLFTFLFVISIWAILRAIRSNSLIWFGTSGVALGAATLVRPATQFYGFVIVLLILIALTTNGKRKTLAVTVFAVANILVLSPLVGYNLNKYGSPQISTNQGKVAWEFMAAELRARSEGITIAAARTELASELLAMDNPYEISAKKLNLTISYAASDPLTFAAKTTEETIRTFIGTGQNIVAREILQLEEPTRGESRGTLFGRIREVVSGSVGELAIALILTFKLLGGYALLSVGLIVLVRRRERLLSILVVVTAAYFTIPAGAIGIGDARLIAPLIPIFVVVSGIGAVPVWERIQLFLRRYIASATASMPHGTGRNC